MDTAGISGLAASSSSSQTLQSTGATSKTAASTAVSASSSDPTQFYSSPIIDFDTATGALIWKFRDTTTGEVLYQSPSRATLLYERSQRLAEDQKQGKADNGGAGQGVSTYG